MITFSNIVRHDNIPFEDYLSIDGKSHSYLKGETWGESKVFKETDKIKIGKMVDAILTEPEKVNMLDPLYPMSAIIATKIRMRFGQHIERMEKQVSYTATLSFLDHSMPAKFRLDFLLPGILVLDLKITHEPIQKIPALVDFMGYKNQLFGYAKVAQVPRAYLLFYSVPSNKCELFDVPVTETNTFWRDKILRFGTVAAQ